MRCSVLPSDSPGTLSPALGCILSWRWPCVCSPDMSFPRLLSNSCCVLS